MLQVNDLQHFTYYYINLPETQTGQRQETKMMVVMISFPIIFYIIYQLFVTGRDDHLLFIESIYSYVLVYRKILIMDKKKNYLICDDSYLELFIEKQFWPVLIHLNILI